MLLVSTVSSQKKKWTWNSSVFSNRKLIKSKAAAIRNSIQFWVSVYIVSSCVVATVTIRKAFLCETSWSDFVYSGFKVFKVKSDEAHLSTGTCCVILWCDSVISNGWVLRWIRTSVVEKDGSEPVMLTTRLQLKTPVIITTLVPNAHSFTCHQP